MYDSPYSVKTHIFEGPLDTLLSLIEKRKLFINDISLAQVADDYIAYIKSLEDFPLTTNEVSDGRRANTRLAIADSAHFILIASTLVLIKSKSLLPNLTLTEEEQDSIEDLEARLREYQKFKALSLHLKERFGIHTEYFRLPSKEKKIVFTPDKQTSVARIREVIFSVIAQIPKKEFIPKTVVQKIISLEEMIHDLTNRITSSIKMSFKDFSGIKGTKDEVMTKENRVYVIVSFLAMLELVKQGIIRVKQDSDFHDIEMETEVVGVPKY